MQKRKYFNMYNKIPEGSGIILHNRFLYFVFFAEPTVGLANINFKGEGVFRHFNFENTILTYGLRVMTWACTINLSVVLGLCAQYCPSEASDQKMSQKPRTIQNDIYSLAVFMINQFVSTS